MMKFLKANKAATALEFGIVFPILLLVLLSIIEFGFTMFFDSSLNAGIREVARTGVPIGYASMDPINDIMKKNLGGLYDPTKATFILRTYNNFSDMKNDRVSFTTDANGPDNFFNGTLASFPPQSCPSPPTNCQSAQIVLYGVRYDWGGLTKLIPFVPNSLYSFSVVRNENFSE